MPVPGFHFETWTPGCWSPNISQATRSAPGALTMRLCCCLGSACPSLDWFPSLSPQAARCGGSIQLCICLLNCKGVGGERVSSSSFLLWKIEYCPHGDFLADNPWAARQEYNQGSQSKQKYPFSYRHLLGETSCPSGKILVNPLPHPLLGYLSCLHPSRALPSSFLTYSVFTERKLACSLSVSPQAINYLSPNFFFPCSLLHFVWW